ncbi:MAG: lysophospholipid acyltransferase family protein [Acidobacteriota bacterium]
MSPESEILPDLPEDVHDFNKSGHPGAELRRNDLVVGSEPANGSPALIGPTAPVPLRSEIEVLDPFERAAVHLVRKMNSGSWKRFWTFMQRHVGSLWIYLATYNLMNVFGLENFTATDLARPVLLVANHRSFFDMYTVSSVIFRRSKRPITLYFPVRAKFFYDNIIGWFVNLVMGWWAMYPPFFREAKDARKREFDKFSVRELIRICSSGRGNVIGFHPEGKRNFNDDPYELLPAQPGIGKVIYESRVQVVPVFISGLLNDLPRQVVGNWTGGPKLRIRFGKAIDLSEYFEKRNSLRTHKAIADHIMASIAEIGEEDRAWMAAERKQDGE